MKCPLCGQESLVIETRPRRAGAAIARRRTCRCGARFSTVEKLCGPVERKPLPKWTDPSNGVSHTPVMGHRYPSNGVLDTPVIAYPHPSNGVLGGRGVDPVPSSLSPLVLEASGESGSGARARKSKKQRQESAEFEAFYKAYPRKVGRDDAWRAWEAKGLEGKLDVVLGALAWQTDQIFSRAPWDKIPHPATWINAGRWKDERPAPTQLRQQAPATAVDRLQHQQQQIYDAVMDFAATQPAGGKP